MTGVVVVGSCNMDLVTRTSRFPRPGEHLVGTAFATFLGGKGANQAVAARRAGATTAMVARVGNDSFGDTIVAALEGEGIDVSAVARDASAPTGNASIWLDAAGENQILVYAGANGTLDPAAAAGALRARHDHGGTGVVLMQLEVPMEAVVASAIEARAHGARVVLNAAPASPLPDALWPVIDVLVVNETEAAALSGDDDPEAMARTLTRRARAVVVTLGANGCLVATADDLTPRLVGPFRPARVVDATGAGDAFCGALGARLAAGATLEDAARWGNAAGSLAVEVLGAIPSMPGREAIVTRLAADA